MRVWDLSPGYLNRQSLLAEHRELHGLRSILVHGKKGYSRHPETIRWLGCLTGLARRHAHLAAEMGLRGYADRTPISIRSATVVDWPEDFVTPPLGQYELLRSKYVGRPPGRIPLPRFAQELWAHHKYSVMARDQLTYREMGRRVARMRRHADATGLAKELVLMLRATPPRRDLVNALEHMWGHVSKAATVADKKVATASAAGLLLKTRDLAVHVKEPYLITSTALSDLALFVAAA